MRESFRLILKNNEQPQIHKYISIICVARHNAIGKDFDIINNSLNNLLKKHN